MFLESWLWNVSRLDLVVIVHLAWSSVFVWERQIYIAKDAVYNTSKISSRHLRQFLVYLNKAVDTIGTKNFENRHNVHSNL